MKAFSSALLLISLCLLMFVSSAKGQNCTQYSSNCEGTYPNNPCACQHGGSCVAPGFTTCQCNTNTTFYAGFYCEVPQCFGLGPKECNTGTCVAPDTCNCTTAGWEGTDCSEPICEEACVNGNCTGPDTCTCDFGWAGTYCEVAENECERSYKPCDNLTVCTNLTPAEGGYRCSDCPSNYTGSPYMFYNTTVNPPFVIRGGCVPVGETSTLPSVYSTSQAPSTSPTSSSQGSNSTGSVVSTGSTRSSSSSAITSSSSTSGSATTTATTKSASASLSISGTNFTFTFTQEDSSSSILAISSAIFAAALLL